MPLEWKAPPGLLGDRDNVRGVFETIYEKRIWGGGSGLGSDPQVAPHYVNLLKAFLNNNPIRSVVDIGCGDWQFSRHIDWGDRTYLGIDVVGSVIEANRRQFARPNISFSHANPLEDGFDVGGDLLLMKDVLQHLSNSNVQKLLRLTNRFRFSLLTNATPGRTTTAKMATLARWIYGLTRSTSRTLRWFTLMTRRRRF
jgi:SAM-dependent methyltransferase